MKALLWCMLVVITAAFAATLRAQFIEAQLDKASVWNARPPAPCVAELQAEEEADCATTCPTTEPVCANPVQSH